MKKEELIKRYCRFYDGTDNFNSKDGDDWLPYLFWKAEYSYIKNQDTREAVDSMRLYDNCGLAGATDELPCDLTATLFSVYCHGTDRDPMDLVEPFKREILPNYLAQSR